MLKLFKFLIWLMVSVIIAYFLIDIKIQDKTVKQHIDIFIQKNETALKIKNKIVEVLGKNKITTPLVEEEKEPTKYNEEISAQDEEQLERVIKKEEKEE